MRRKSSSKRQTQSPDNGLDPTWEKIYKEIIRPGLSTHSGTCIGLSKGTLTIDDPDGKCIPIPTGKRPVPSICYEASPEINPSYPEMNEIVFGKREQASPLLGEYCRILIAYHMDPKIRSNAASGGILTGCLLHLLKTGEIKGAVVLTMDKEHPWRAIPIIARTKEEIINSAQSKYVVSPVNTILGELELQEGPLAYVGLPHQVFAIRRLQYLMHPSVKQIKYIFGPFFGNELYGSSIVSFLRRFGAGREDIERLNYRAGEWPGHMEVKLKNGRVLRLPKFHANYLIPFHITKSSLLSHDLTNEFTDLSGGDAWAPVYEERGKGFSLVIVRTQTGDDLISSMEERGKIWTKDISEEEAIRMQSHGLDFKKRGTFIRIAILKKLGKKVPEYDMPHPTISTKRWAFELILSTCFVICSFPITRYIADLIPNFIIGPTFIWFRNVWKRHTRNIKRSGLVP